MDLRRNRWALLVLVFAVLLGAVGVVAARAYRRARAKACGPPSCISNVKQLALGFSMYVEDYDGCLPPQRSWPKAISPYIKNLQVLICWSDQRSSRLDPTKGESSYALSGSLPSCLDLTKGLRRYARLPALFDATDLVGTQSIAAYRHRQTDRRGVEREGLNVGFCDGHARWVERGEFEGMKMDP